MTIDITKPLRTRDGREVRGVFIDDACEMIVGSVKQPDGEWSCRAWDMKGVIYCNPEHGTCLVQAAEKHVRYVNFYRDMMHESCADHESARVAESKAADGRIACVRVKFEEGQMDP